MFKKCVSQQHIKYYVFVQWSESSYILKVLLHPNNTMRIQYILGNEDSLYVLLTKNFRLYC